MPFSCYKIVNTDFYVYPVRMTYIRIKLCCNLIYVILYLLAEIPVDPSRPLEVEEPSWVVNKEQLKSLGMIYLAIN